MSYQQWLLNDLHYGLQMPDQLKSNYPIQSQLQMKQVKRIMEKMLEMAANSFTPSHRPTTTIPNNCPTDCNMLLKSKGTRNIDIDFHIALSPFS